MAAWFAPADRPAPPPPPAVFEILSRQPKHGVGSRLSRNTWKDDSFWTVSDVKLSLVRAQGRGGRGGRRRGQRRGNASELTHPPAEHWTTPPLK